MGLSRNILKMNKLGQVEPFTFVLSTKNYKHLGKLNNVKTDTIDFKANLNSANEISFEVYKNLNGEVESLWDDIIDLKSIYVPELDEYFEINVVYNDKLDELKIITGTSLCEAELSQTIIRGTEINTETDIDRPDYSQTTFYNEVDPKASLLNRVLSFAPHYRIGYVDSTLHNIQRSFSIDGTSIYDFLVGECAEQFNCIFVFDSTKRKINVYDLYTTCYECGHRDAYNFVCPECGSENVNYFGQDTTIFVSKENLSDDIKLETDIGSIKNCFRLRAGDEDMTAAIASINPNGTAYIYYIPPEQRADMSSELINKIDSYDELVEQYTPEYQELAQDIRDLEDEITYYNSTMMPAPVIDGEEVPEDSISKTEIVNLTVENLSPVGIEKLSSSTSKSTADTVVKNYARVFVNTSLVKIDVVDSAFEYKEQDSDGWDYGIWTGKLKLTAYSDANDIAITDTLTLTIHDNYGDFLKQKVMKDMALNDKEGSVFDVLNIEEFDDFKEALTKYCLSRLNSFRLSLDTAITTLMSLDQASEEADWYASIYVPYHEKLLACADEIIVREATINELEEQLSSLYARKSEIQSILNFEDYLGTDLYLEFCTYRREDEYHNENYISDGFSNAEIIDKAKEFLEVAKKELIRSATAQHTISSNMYNIMLMEEFKPLVDKFALGNFIRVQAGDELYRLRLNNYQITFSDLSTINTEFSDMTKSVNVVAATQKILSDAQSMASNFSYISKQAEKGKNANDSLSNIVQEGLDSSLTQIKNNTSEETVIDNNGYLGRALDDVTGKYFPEQLRVTHNNIVFTETNWASASCALGKHKYTFYDPENKMFKKNIGYGLSSKFVQAGYVYGTQIIGGDIYSENYSSTDGKGTHINLNDGTFSFAGGNLKYDGSTLSLEGKINATEGGTIGGFTIGSNSIYNGTDSLTSTDKGVYLGTDGIRNYESDGANVTIADGVLTANGANITGTIKADNGEIGGFTINANSIVSGTWGSSGSVMMCTGTGTQKSIGGSASTVNGWCFTAGSKFGVTKDGALYSTSGKIGGFSIDSEGMYNGTWGTDGSVMMCVGTANTKTIAGKSSNGWCFTAGSKFGVTKSGDLYATSANITGTITATGGTIGGCSISNGKLVVPSANISGTITATSLNAATGSITSVTATNLTVTSGKITLGAVTLDSTSGSSIGNFKVDSNSLYMGTWSSPNTTPSIFIASSASNQNYTIAGVSSKRWAIGAGGKFGVTLDGEMYCKTGSIGNLHIDTNGNLHGSTDGSYMVLYPNGATSGSTTYFMKIFHQGTTRVLTSSGTWTTL